jgi:molybdopterin converting factor small subunit
LSLSERLIMVSLVCIIFKGAVYALKVKVCLHEILRKKADITEAVTEVGGLSIVIPVEATVSELLALLKLNHELVGLVIVNKRQVGLNYILSDGDSLELFSPLCGG